MSPSPLSEAELSALPVFPLPRVVFFPGTELPLHVFEPRYLRMVDDCLTGGPRVIAVALLRAGWQPDDDRPRIHPISGVGRIQEHHVLPNGTRNIVLAGLARVRLEELPSDDRPYRRAHAVVLPDEVPKSGIAATDIAALLSCASSIAAVVQREHPEFSLGVGPDDPPGTVADRIADRLVADTELRQRILETVNVGERIRLVMDPIGELLATLSSPARTSRYLD